MSETSRDAVPAGGPRAWLSRLVLLALIAGIAVYALDAGPFAKLELSLVNTGTQELREVDVRWRGGRVHTGRLGPGESVAESIRADAATGFNLSFATDDGPRHPRAFADPGQGRPARELERGAFHPLIEWCEEAPSRIADAAAHVEATPRARSAR